MCLGSQLGTLDSIKYWVKASKLDMTKYANSRFHCPSQNFQVGKCNHTTNFLYGDTFVIFALGWVNFKMQVHQKLLHFSMLVHISVVSNCKLNCSNWISSLCNLITIGILARSTFNWPQPTYAKCLLHNVINDDLSRHLGYRGSKPKVCAFKF